MHTLCVYTQVVCPAPSTSKNRQKSLGAENKKLVKKTEADEARPLHNTPNAGGS